MSYTPRSLFRLIEDIDARRLLLPHIQRPFVWEKEQMERLFDSLMREYPIQTFLFWRTKEEIRARCFMDKVDFDLDLSTLYDMNRSSLGVEKVFVLDGQQRLQTLHTIFRGGIYNEGKLEEAYFDVTSGNFDLDNGDVLFHLVFSNKPLDFPMFRIRDLIEKYKNGDPLGIADEINDFLEHKFTDEGTEQRKQRERFVRSNIQQLYSILNYDKHFWIDELDGVAKQYPYRRILDIFVRVNSGGTKLTAGDLMFAAMKEGWDDIEERVEQIVDLLNQGKLNIDSDFVLKCLLLTHGEGAEIQTEKFYGIRGEKLIKHVEETWDRAESTFRRLREFITFEVRVFSHKLIRSYNALVPIFDFLFHNPGPTSDIKLLTAYYHKAQLFNWYSSATDSVLNALHSFVGKNCGDSFPLNEIKSYFIARGNSVELLDSHLSDYRLRAMILNIVYSERWENPPFEAAYKGYDPHVDYIYPQYMLRSRLGLSSSVINDIGNLRFVGSKDFIRKRGELPDSYFKRLKNAKVPLEKHLFLTDYANNPSLLKFDISSFKKFREKRKDEIWKSLKKIVDPEMIEKV